MLEMQTATSAAARSILDATGTQDGARISDLEKQAAREGQRELARELHAKRVQVDERRAYEILAGGSFDVAQTFKLAKRLNADKHTGLARRLLKRVRRGLRRSEYPDIYLKIFQQSALFTYKDPDLPLAWRLDRALEILQEVEDLATTPDAESLGLAGAIFKRKWEVDSGRHHLERALFYYLRGYAQGAPADQRGRVLQYLWEDRTRVLDADHDRGYTGINAAFILDLLARQEEEESVRAGLASEAARQRRESARLIREDLIRSVPPLLRKPGSEWLAEEWWFYATIGEAYFGLGAYDPSNYERALEWLRDRPAAAGLTTRVGSLEPVALQVPEWEYESTARQLARLARLQQRPGITEAEFEASAAGRALAAFLHDDHEAVRSAFRGKFGLALSGGGFRASLFHIGVLASLAELGVLPHVEVISCVSGGSIIGAHYYLELRRLLEARSDSDLRREDYVEIVRRIEETFLAGVQRNIRTRVLAEWTTNLKMIFQAGYSRTLRVGELYERELFSRVPDNGFEGPRVVPDWLASWFGWRRGRWLNELRIHPMTDDGTRALDFAPRNHNWRRRNKVPVLILNATSLNTGHCWQFTASFMGEPPTPVNAEIDSNDRLRRMYYKDAPPAHRRVRLGHAVAASSCVPGLFEPLMLDGLYPDRSVRLVDGGVCDNQGVGSLLEQDCTVTLVSDASGQMESQRSPSIGLVGVPLRSNSILQARVREAQYSDIAMRRQSSLLRALMFVHLKRDLPAEQIPWQEIPSHLRDSDFVPKRDAGDDSTSYNVDLKMQRRLAAIRTDLDSFSEAEAFSLMTSGYLMTRAQCSGQHPSVEGFEAPPVPVPWRFLRIARDLGPRSPATATADDDDRRRKLARLLDVGASSGFRIWKLSPVLKAVAGILLLAAGAGLASIMYVHRHTAILPAALAGVTVGAVGRMVLTMIFFAVLALLVNQVVGRKHGRALMRVVRWRDTLRSVLVGIAMASIGFLIARLHLHVFDRWFLRAGRVVPRHG